MRDRARPRGPVLAGRSRSGVAGVLPRLAVALAALGGARALAIQTGPPPSPQSWTEVPDRLLVVEADGATSKCGWFVTLDDRLVALRSVSGTPVPERRDHSFAAVRAVIERQPNHQPLAMPGLLATADGQRLPGEPRISAGRLLWRNRWTGEVAVPLEDLASVRLGSEGVMSEAGDGDLVELVNGDRLEGLVASIGVDVIIEDSAPSPGASEREAVKIPLERVRSIRLLSPRVDPKGPRAWFTDGTVAAGRIVADEASGGMRFIPALPASSRFEEADRESIRVRPEDLRAYLPEAGDVVALASLPASEMRSTGSWPSYAPPDFSASKTPGPADAADLVIHGAGAVEWSLPPGAWTLVAEAFPHAPNAAWTSFDLVVRNGSEEVFRQAFSAESPAIELRVPVASPSISIEVTEGDRGPIADAIRLRRALLLRR